MELDAQNAVSARTRIAVDIGSTVIKIARVDDRDEIVRQDFHPRDFAIGIAAQVEVLLDRLGSPANDDDVLVCSSANGGLRVGIVCVSKTFSGAALRNQVLSAGANPIYVRELDEQGPNLSPVDILIVGGGIDCDDAGPFEQRLRGFRPDDYRYGSLVYAGNTYFAESFQRLHSEATIIPNPLADNLAGRINSVMECVRRAYLDDLVYKQGVSELRSNLAHGIRPTPEIVNRGFHRAVLDSSSIKLICPCVAIDIGGATTDLHYTVEIVQEDSAVKPLAGVSVARYVFTDLGIVASRDSLLLQMRRHPRLYEFLDSVLERDVRETYRSMREGEYQPSADLLSYGCLFLAFDRFRHGAAPGLPVADLAKLAEVVLSGGAAQGLNDDVVARVMKLVVGETGGAPVILIDRDYRLWVDGITWSSAGLA